MARNYANGTTQKEKYRLQGLACEALEKYFGFAPSRKQISLLEWSGDKYITEYLLFSVYGHEEREYRMTMKYNGNIRCEALGYEFTVLN